MRVPLVLASAVMFAASLISQAEESAPNPVTPTDFEVFAAKPDAKVTFSSEVGRIESSDAKAAFTALIVDDGQETNMRGVRIDLESNSGREQVYLNQSQLDKAYSEARMMEKGIETDAMKDTTTPYRVTGTESCWMPKPRVRILCPDYYIGPDWSGLRLRALGSRGFEFPDHKPAELSKLLEAAILELRLQ